MVEKPLDFWFGLKILLMKNRVFNGFSGTVLGLCFRILLPNGWTAEDEEQLSTVVVKLKRGRFYAGYSTFIGKEELGTPQARDDVV